MRFEAAVSGATFRTTDIPITVKLRTEATTYISTNNVLTAGLYPGPGFYQIILKSLIFAADGPAIA